MSVIESMVSGLPCIVSGTSEETVGLEDLIVREDNSEKWANRILTLSDSTQISTNCRLYAGGIAEIQAGNQ